MRIKSHRGYNRCRWYYYLQRNLQPARAQGAAPLGGGALHQHLERVGPEQGQKARVRCRGRRTQDRKTKEEEADVLEKGAASQDPGPSTVPPYLTLHLPPFHGWGQGHKQAAQGGRTGRGGQGWPYPACLLTP